MAEEFLQAGGNKIMPLRKTSVNELNPMILHQNKEGGDLRKKEYLLKIKDIEDYIQSADDWQQLCWTEPLDDNGKCSKEKSLVSPLIFLQFTDQRDSEGIPKSLEDLT